MSTIHSFLWTFIRGFQNDIKVWVTLRLDEKILELESTAANFGSRVQQRTRDKNARDILRHQRQQARISGVNSFAYGTGSDYAKGILGHDDIIRMVPQLLIHRPLLRTILAQQFPFVFVDESQDTFENVVAALKAVALQERARFCLGFFGDPMQKIYPNGIGTIPLESEWSDITKPENFRCPTAVLDVANAIRRDADGLAQSRGRMIKRDGVMESVVGSAQIFVLPADNQRDEKLARVRAWAAQASGDPLWNADKDDVKILVIVHRMAANRLGFGSLYAALNDQAPEAFSSGILDGTAWPLQPFMKFILPLAEAVENNREFEVMQILRKECPLLRTDQLSGVDLAQRLASLRALTITLQEMISLGSATTNAEVLTYVHDSQLFALDPRVLSYLSFTHQVPPQPDAIGDDEQDTDAAQELSREIAAMEAFLRCPATEFWGYRTYINEKSPFSTQHGIKGAEFDRVLVILDDEEGAAYRQFSYDKYFGLKPLSDGDIQNRREGKETSIDRTRRLFYVCCTRALQDLVVVMFTSDVGLATRRIREMQLFPETSIHTIDALSLRPLLGGL